MHLIIIGLIRSLRLIDHFSARAALFLHIDLIQSIHDVLLVIILLFDAFRAVQGAAVGVFPSVILGDPLSALPLWILDFNAVEYLLFDNLEDARDYRGL